MHPLENKAKWRVSERSGRGEPKLEWCCSLALHEGAALPHAVTSASLAQRGGNCLLLFFGEYSHF